MFDDIGTPNPKNPKKFLSLKAIWIDAAIAQTNHSISVDNNTVPDAFFGIVLAWISTTNFNDYNSDISINLTKEKGTIDETNSIVKGFNKLQAGKDRNTLISLAPTLTRLLSLVMAIQAFGAARATINSLVKVAQKIKTVSLFYSSTLAKITTLSLILS